MNRRRLVRVQLVLLALLVALIVIRLVVGPPAPDGVVVLTDLDDEELYHRAFTLQQPARVAVEATGSFERAASGSTTPPLDVYGWIVRRGDRSVTWKMDATNTRPERGTVGTVADTLRLDAGTYDAFFTTFGNAFSGNRPWRHDEERWRFVLNPVEGGPGRARPDDDLEDAAPAGAALLWTSAPTSYRDHREFVFEVSQASPVRLYTLGQIEEGRPMDYAWIENASTGARAWTMGLDNTQAAGGLPANRRFEGTLTLEPGFYRAVYQTDDTHNPGRWQANPPLDPAAWGLSLYRTETSAIAPFDPWQTREPVINMTRVPDDAYRSQAFRVDRPTQVVVYTTGEITGAEDIWDYGWLEDAASGDTLWTMTWNRSHPAGGSKKNRTEVTFLTLQPGSYTLHYRTDGSHAYDDWNARRPDHPERWGTALFALDDASAIQTGVRASRPPMTAAPAPAPPRSFPGASTIVAWERVKGEADLTHTFNLDAPARLHIYALGERTMHGWHDYGWIEDATTGETVWEMTSDNTVPVGADGRNRLADATVELAPGRYVAHYASDFSHHFEDFGRDAPQRPEAWGMTILRLPPQ